MATLLLRAPTSQNPLTFEQGGGGEQPPAIMNHHQLRHQLQTQTSHSSHPPFPHHSQHPPHPSHFTPPTKNYKIKNPFEKHLVDRLNSQMCSPGMFKIRESSGNFKWDIEQVSILKPADIVACNSQFDPSPDPVLEKKASEAIEKFFSQELIVPSPFDEAPKRAILLPIEPKEAPAPINDKKFTICTQTQLTFPVMLPPEVENALKPFYTYNKDQPSDPDISANASLRRKLCFEEFSDEDDQAFVEDVKCLNIENFQHIPMRGLKRTLETSFETCVTYSNNIKNEVISLNESTSPMLEGDPIIRFSNEIVQGLKSPSLSPIRHVPILQQDLDYPKSFEKLSEENTSHHDSNTSVFSQSTPEKSDRNSEASINTTPDLYETSAMHLLKSNFNENMSQFGKNNYKLYKRSQSEYSLSALSKNGSDHNMDISSDVSAYFSKNHSFQSPIIGNSTESISSHHLSGNLEMEGIHSNFNINANSETTMVNNAINVASAILDKETPINMQYICDKSAINFENVGQFTKMYRNLTPSKNLNRDYLADLLNKSPKRNAWSTHVASPAQMSLDNSFNIDSDKNFIKDFLPISMESNVTVLHDATLNMCPQNETNLNFITDEKVNKNSTSEKFLKLDSGFIEHLASNNTTLNSTKYNCTMDATKSFQSSNEISTVRWKRFDSGFHDETSSDFVQQLNSNDSLKFSSKKYNPIAEFMEEKQSINFENLNKLLVNESHAQESMSVSDIFADDMVSLINSNFSSTPSKAQYKRL